MSTLPLCTLCGAEVPWRLVHDAGQTASGTPLYTCEECHERTAHKPYCECSECTEAERILHSDLLEWERGR